ncbi:MAG: crossover junction endodeoxyribonuclease RuvC [Pseudomonadales bacterium]|nr:crossover junction endodeoxyribonuclease RuvC [Pseudomonadales bacterium]
MIQRTHSAPPPPVRVLGLDPSLTCTGWGVIESFPTRPQGLCIAHGFIDPPGAVPDGLVERLLYLSTAVRAVIAKHGPTHIALEKPEDKPRPAIARTFKRSTLTLPLYGVAVGVVIAAAMEAIDRDRILTPAPSDWLSDDIPRPNRKDGGDDPDFHKERRARYAESIWKLKRNALGVKSKAGNVADALFIARHTLYRAVAAANQPRGSSCTARSTPTS